tara:strand:+ start:1780 stop:2205 length:426 start_codon:yes stop_codon:yes gene_type:complete
MYEYRCEIVKVIDGDTVDVNIDLGFGVWLRKERIRLRGIDTPESRTRDVEEKKYGLLAKNFLQKLLHDNHIILKTHKDAEGKFGRILGDLWVDKDTMSINQHLVDNYHAVIYEGQSKEQIKQAHLSNRKQLESWQHKLAQR